MHASVMIIATNSSTNFIYESLNGSGRCWNSPCHMLTGYDPEAYISGASVSLERGQRSLKRHCVTLSDICSVCADLSLHRNAPEKG